jgi:U3 small nucleolar RNA-associated protein 3
LVAGFMEILFLLAVVRQSKIMKQRAGMENDDEEEEEEEEKEKSAWGKGKRIYYSADNVEYELQSSDEEAPAEEEAEALRLQKEMAASLRPEDYDVSDTESDDNSEKETFEVMIFSCCQVLLDTDSSLNLVL